MPDVITLNRQTSQCLIKKQDGQIVRSNAVAVGLALIAEYSGREGAQTVGDMEWLDMLTSHGVALALRGKEKMVLCKLPEIERRITMRGTQYSAILPRLLAGFHLDDGVLQRGCLWLLNPAQEAQVNVGNTIATALQPFPFGNVYGDSGRICWGTVSTADIRSMGQMTDLFFGSEFNDDLTVVKEWYRAIPANKRIVYDGNYTMSMVRAVDHLGRR